MELATLTEYWPIDSTLTPPTRLPSSPSHTSRYSNPTAIALVVSADSMTNSALYATDATSAPASRPSASLPPKPLAMPAATNSGNAPNMTVSATAAAYLDRMTEVLLTGVASRCTMLASSISAPSTLVPMISAVSGSTTENPNAPRNSAGHTGLAATSLSVTVISSSTRGTSRNTSARFLPSVARSVIRSTTGFSIESQPLPAHVVTRYENTLSSDSSDGSTSSSLMPPSLHSPASSLEKAPKSEVLTDRPRCVSSTPVTAGRPIRAAPSARSADVLTRNTCGLLVINRRIARKSPEAASRPPTITWIVPDIRSTSSRMCELNRIVLPCPAIRSSRSIISSRCLGSIPLNGSSSSSTRGSCTNAAATLIRCRIPFE